VVFFAPGKGYLAGTVTTPTTAQSKNVEIKTPDGRDFDVALVNGLVSYNRVCPDMRPPRGSGRALQDPFDSLRWQTYLWRVSSIDAKQTPVSSLVRVWEVDRKTRTFTYTFFADALAEMQTHRFQAPMADISRERDPQQLSFPDMHFLPHSELTRADGWSVVLHPHTLQIVPTAVPAAVGVVGGSTRLKLKSMLPRS
jgi:hypothetical protein